MPTLNEDRRIAGIETEESLDSEFLIDRTDRRRFEQPTSVLRQPRPIDVPARRSRGTVAPPSPPPSELPRFVRRAFAPASAPRAEQSIRSCPRVDLSVMVDLRSESNFYTGLTRNISTGGLFIATNALRLVGSRLRVRFWLPGDDVALESEAEVRWTREASSLTRREGPTGMGVQFIDLPAEAATRISRFMYSRDSIYFEQ